MTLVDSDALFDSLTDRGDAERVARLLERGEVAIAAVTVYELYAGVTKECHLRERYELAGLVDVVDLSAAIARSAAELYTALKAAVSRASASPDGPAARAYSARYFATAL